MRMKERKRLKERERDKGREGLWSETMKKRKRRQRREMMGREKERGVNNFDFDVTCVCVMPYFMLKCT